MRLRQRKKRAKIVERDYDAERGISRTPDQQRAAYVDGAEKGNGYAHWTCSDA